MDYYIIIVEILELFLFLLLYEIIFVPSVIIGFSIKEQNNVCGPSVMVFVLSGYNQTQF